MPIDLTVSSSNKYINILPVDPINDASYFYSYYSGGSYELQAVLANPNSNSINDDGSLTGTFEMGSPNRTFVTPLQRDKGLKLYVDFENNIYDKSGYGNVTS